MTAPGNGPTHPLVIRHGATRGPAWGRLLLSAAFLAALLAASPAHAHSTVGAEAACAACTFHGHSLSLEVGLADVEHDLGPGANAPASPEPEAPAGVESPSRSRAPPFFS